MTQTNSLKPGEVIHQGTNKLATCSTCPYCCELNPKYREAHNLQDDLFACYHLDNRMEDGDAAQVIASNFCNKHPLRDVEVRKAEALERIAENIDGLAEFLVNEGTDQLALKLDKLK